LSRKKCHNKLLVSYVFSLFCLDGKPWVILISKDCIRADPASLEWAEMKAKKLACGKYVFKNVMWSQICLGRITFIILPFNISAYNNNCMLIYRVQ